MKLPVQVSSLQEALPHRPPMVWLDEVTDAGPDGGICSVTVTADRLFAGDDGFALDFAPVEWMAEAYGYSRAVHARSEGRGAKGLQRAFLVGVGQLELPCRLPVGKKILVEVRTTREMPPLVLVKGQVRGEQGELYAEGQLKLYFEE